MTRITDQLSHFSGDPLTRFFYALGVAMLVFGAITKGQHQWTLAGIVLILFCHLFE